MAPLPLRPGHRLLLCPICRLGLDARESALACRNGHSFDLAQEGYVNLLPGGRRRPPAGGDRPEQLSHRAAFLDAGHFDFIGTAVTAQLRLLGAMPPARRRRILDTGCGTGHHLAGLLPDSGRDR